jgi:hypothetical protein
MSTHWLTTAQVLLLLVWPVTGGLWHRPALDGSRADFMRASSPPPSTSLFVGASSVRRMHSFVLRAPRATLFS